MSQIVTGFEPAGSKILRPEDRDPDLLQERLVAMCGTVTEDDNARRLIVGAVQAGWRFAALPGKWVDMWAPAQLGVAVSYTPARNPVLWRAVKQLVDAKAIPEVAGRNRMVRDNGRVG